MQFKSTGLRDQFHSDKIEILLRACLLDLARFMETDHNKQLVVTSIFRPAAEQLCLCRNGSFKSSFRHCVWAAADLRSRNLTQLEREELLSYAKKRWWGYATLTYHSAGTGSHFHLQLQDRFTDMSKIQKILKEVKGAKDWYVG